MRIGMVGLGRMGGNMARRLIVHAHEIVGWARSAESVRAAVADGVEGAASLEDLVARLTPPRAVWVMVPAGRPTEDTVARLGELLAPGDVVIDGGNTFYKDDVRRAAALAARGIDYLDVGTSGGVWGLTRGYCLMIGGPQRAVERLAPIFQSLAPGRGELAPVPGRGGRGGSAEEGWLHCGPVGAGHYVKMLHNGIEYGLMQAYAEGFHLLRAAAGPEVPAEYRYDIDVADVAELWRRGSVIPSWLLDLSAQALAGDPQLAGYTGRVADSGEGRWTVETAVERAVPAEVLTAALFARFRSRLDNTFAEKLLSAMRAGFGGHGEAPEKK